MTCLLLRPDTKVAKSCDYLRTQGIDVVGLALISIQPDQNVIQQLPAIFETMPATSLAIFTSTHAVEAADICLNEMPLTANVWAIGTSTQAKLVDKGIAADTPKQQDSEGLLAALPAELNNSNVYIFKGHGGRTTLKQGLISAGANVVEANLYKRQKTAQPSATDSWNKAQIRCIIATSGEQIDAAFDYFEKGWLLELDWIVVSERLKHQANILGVSRVRVSQGASDKAIAECISASWE